MTLMMALVSFFSSFSYGEADFDQEFRLLLEEDNAVFCHQFRVDYTPARSDVPSDPEAIEKKIIDGVTSYLPEISKSHEEFVELVEQNRVEFDDGNVWDATETINELPFRFPISRFESVKAKMYLYPGASHTTFIQIHGVITRHNPWKNARGRGYKGLRTFDDHIHKKLNDIILGLKKSDGSGPEAYLINGQDGPIFSGNIYGSHNDCGDIDN